MIVLTIVAMTVAALLLLTFYLIKNKTSASSTTIQQTKHTSKFNNTRGNFVVSILAGYLITASLTVLGFVATEGADGLATGLFVFLASPLYASPVLFAAVTIGYPLYRICRNNSVRFIILWWAYTVSAIVSALSIAVIACLFFQSFDEFAGIAIFVSIPSLLVAVPTSVYTWIKQKPA